MLIDILFINTCSSLPNKLNPEDQLGRANQLHTEMIVDGFEDEFKRTREESQRLAE